MRTPIKNVRALLPALLAVGAIAAGIAACGGSGSGAGSGGGGYHRAGSVASSSAAKSGQRQVPAAHVAAVSTGILQHNAGDMDADNNGAPSDGDGNL
jgi:hypothetical protein